MENHQKIAEIIAKVWEKKDYPLLQQHLDEHVIWQEGPFREPLDTPVSVVEQWRKDLKTQTDINVETEVLATEGNLGCYNFHASWHDTSRGYIEIDGIFLIELSPQGKILKFNQWYEVKPA